MKDLQSMTPGYYWCTHELAMWVPEGQEFPREWHVVYVADGCVAHAGADQQTSADEVPDYVSFYGPLVAPSGAWQPIDTAPTDGTTVIVRHQSAGDTIIRGAFWISVEEAQSVGDSPDNAGWWSYSNSVGRDQLDGHHAPTHWMPLPD